MRTTTLTRGFRVALILAGLLVLPQFAFAQLSAIETKVLKLQGATSGAVTMDAPGAITSYKVSYPSAIGAVGGILYLKSVSGTDGTLAFTSTAGIQNGWTPIWDGTDIVWADPAGASNPNWSLTGNNKSSGSYTLGFTDGSSTADIAIKTKNATRIAISSAGDVTISNQTTFNTSTGADLVVTETGVTRADDIAINPGTGKDITTDGGITSAENVTITDGGLTLSGTTNPLSVRASVGTDGAVLVSKGAGASPEWQNLSNATGIKRAGLSEANDNDQSIDIAVNNSGLLASDAILVFTEGASGVVAAVTARVTTAGSESFTVSFSGNYSGKVNYLVMKAKSTD